MTIIAKSWLKTFNVIWILKLCDQMKIASFCIVSHIDKANYIGKATSDYWS
jgi:hypothetical protein